ncbi:hypothetical protein [Bacillus alkalicellulosilyticus]|uniref:hypothetical protein n=1 Tax=Alkalihalobacterium alkalicellulosilyticum TaxID=1912214 RepID=UPI0009984F08|nr:hypothetical protein [Bacillus alkalicellulosilyticus]
MIQIHNNQILTSHCLNCPDDYFAPAESDVPHVGCCSYSPVFSLFEVYQAVKDNHIDFFINEILQHKSAVINDFEIKVQAMVDSRFSEKNLTGLSQIEMDDLQLSYSMCQYFKQNMGCSLPLTLKNSTCRSFICSSVENMLPKDQQNNLKTWVNQIKREAATFNKTQQAILQERQLMLMQDFDSIIDYFTQYIQDNKITKPEGNEES